MKTMHLMTACLMPCLMRIFRVGSTEVLELPTWGDWAPEEWIDEWYNNDAGTAMLENSSPPRSQAPPGLEAHKAQTNHGLARNTHALVGDGPFPWDLRATTHPRPKGSNSQVPVEHPFPLWAGAQQPSVGPQFTSDSSHTSPASLPPNAFPFSDNPHPHESSAAQEEHHTSRANSHDFPIGHSAAEPMSSHLPIPYPPAQAVPEIQTTHPQDAGLDTTRSNPTGLFGHEQNLWDLQTITSQLTDDPNSHLTSLSPSSAPQSITNLASDFSHLLHVPETPQQSSFKTRTLRSKQRARQRISKLKPSTEPRKKQTHRAKKISTKNSSGLSQTTDLVSLLSDTELYTLLEKSLPLPAETINEPTPHLEPLEFHMSLFENNSPQEVMERAKRGLFQHQIDQLPERLLIIREGQFQDTYLDYLGQKDPVRSSLKSKAVTDQLEKIFIEKLSEFYGDRKSWYRRWRMITSFDFEKDPPLPNSVSDDMANFVKGIFPMYLFYVEMICSIVPRDSMTSRDLKTELKSAQELFDMLSSHPSKLLQNRLVKNPKDVWRRCISRILWTYLAHWMRNERPGVFRMNYKSDDVVNGTKAFFNRAFAFSYSALARKYICK